MYFILIFYVYKSKFNMMYAVSFIYSNLSPHGFPFSSFQGKFSLSKDNGLFSLLPLSMVVFYMEFMDFLIAHKCNHSFGSLLTLESQSQAPVFSPFGRWQGGSSAWGGLPELECKMDRHSLSIARPQEAAHKGEYSTNYPIYIPPPI